MRVLAKILYGSHLYGTSVPESDTDYRYVVLPELNDCLLDRVKHSYPNPGDEDGHVFSLQEFCKLACDGQSVALEMLHAPDHCVLETSPYWSKLRVNARRFHTKRMTSFVGFAKTMAGKYSSRVDRMRETEAVLTAMVPEAVHTRESLEPKLWTIWDRLPESTNARKTTNERNSGAEKRVYQVCGRELQATVTIQHAYSVVRAIHDSYGERVRAVSEGRIEWKALAHAFRAALQAREILQTGNLVFPLKDADWLRSLRLGQIDFAAEGLDKRLDDLIAEVQGLMDVSALPEKADRAFCDELILEAYACYHQTPFTPLDER